MPLFGRKKSEATAPPAPAVQPAIAESGPAGDLACEHPDCNRHDGVRCAYKDRRDSSCHTQWCPDHYQLVDGTPFCRRHVAIARALTHHSSAYAVAPDIENRAPSLCEWVAAAIDARVMGAMQEARSAQPGSTVSTEPLELVLEGTPRKRYWERSWKLADHTGPLAKLVIRVSEDNDREVMAMVGRQVMAAVVPPWVDRSATDEASRAGFYAGILNALSRGLADYLKTNQAAHEGRHPG
ncbi:MAG: hypothetical protein ACR2MY_07375 [Candidatus Dormibacteria bacterium]